MVGSALWQVRARSAGRKLLSCGAVSLWLISAGARAAPPKSNPPEVPARDGLSYRGSSYDQFHVVCRSGTAPGDQSVLKTFVDMTPAQLSQAVPESKRLRPAENQDMLPQILQRVGTAVAAFFDDFADTACTEQVISVVHSLLHAGAKHFDHTYSYLAISEAGSARPTLREYRTDTQGQPVNTDAKSGIVTFGFVALPLNFHPDYQADSRFSYLGREEMENQDTYVVAFAQRPNVARLPASVWFLNRRGVVFLQGVAWIDPTSFRIVRLRTDIQQAETNVGLQKETTQVLYSAVSFAQSGKTLWLPREVTVTGQLREYNFHNQHRYSDYRLFNVQIQQKQTLP